MLKNSYKWSKLKTSNYNKKIFIIKNNIEGVRSSRI